MQDHASLVFGPKHFAICSGSSLGARASVLLFFVLAMAWRGGAGRGKGGKGRKGSKSSESKPTQKEGSATKELEYLQAVQPQWHINKASLRPFASATGSPFYTGRSQSDADFLSIANIMENKLEPYASEIVNRLGLAVSEAGGTVSMGSELLEKYAADPAEVATKLGIQGVGELLQSEAGKAFVQAAAVFNRNDETVPKTTAALHAAAARWTDFLLENPKAKAKAVQRLVKSSATLYLLGMELLQWLAAAQHPQKWANKMKGQKSLQNEKVQKWMRAPSEKDRLVAAIVASYQEQIEPPQKKRQALSDSEGPSPPSVAADGAESSGGEEKSNSSQDKKKSKKAKKADKKADKKVKKDKKSNKNKKVSSSSSRDLSDSPSPATTRRRKATPAEPAKKTPKDEAKVEEVQD